MKSFTQFLNESPFHSTLRYNEKLNPALWDEDGHLDPIVRAHLLAIAKEWQDTAYITDDVLTDIIMTGGNCNYNYTDESDIDVHLVVDMALMPVTDPDLLTDYIKTKKDIWADRHNDITIKGYPVELYAQDISVVYNNDHGVYSLMFDKWLVFPQHFDNIDYNDPVFVGKVNKFMRSINTAIKDKVPVDVAKELMKAITSPRANAIATGGEFAQDNLVFKELRNRGYLQKISDYIRKTSDAQLSLKK